MSREELDIRAKDTSFADRQFTTLYPLEISVLSMRRGAAFGAALWVAGQRSRVLAHNGNRK